MTHELYAINDKIRQFGLPELTTYLFYILWKMSGQVFIFVSWQNCYDVSCLLYVSIFALETLLTKTGIYIFSCIFIALWFISNSLGIVVT